MLLSVVEAGTAGLSLDTELVTTRNILFPNSALAQFATLCHSRQDGSDGTQQKILHRSETRLTLIFLDLYSSLP